MYREKGQKHGGGDVKLSLIGVGLERRAKASTMSSPDEIII